LNLLSKCRATLLGGATCLLVLPAAAEAGDAGAPASADPSEIIVTAQRRPERIQSTPIAIAAFDGDFIVRTRLDDVKDLVTYAPGFSGDSQDSYIDGLAIRGIVSNDYGIGGDPRSASSRTASTRAAAARPSPRCSTSSGPRRCAARRASCSAATRFPERSA
jgi:outer membrane receptor protein involved in Fe transport